MLAILAVTTASPTSTAGPPLLPPALLGTSCEQATPLLSQGVHAVALRIGDSAAPFSAAPPAYNLTQCADPTFSGTGAAFWLRVDSIGAGALQVSTCDSSGFDTDVSLFRGRAAA